MPRSCPRGSIYRKPYTRRSKTGKKVKVPGVCIRSVSASGRKRAELNKEIEALLKKIRKLSTRKRDKELRCPKGFIKRSAYYRSAHTKRDRSGRRRRISGTLVPASCVRDVGRRGKGKSLVGKLRKGDLKKFGYENVDTLSVEERTKALKKAIRAYGYLPVIKKLNAVYVLTRGVNPKLAGKFKRDQQMVSREYNKKVLAKINRV